MKITDLNIKQKIVLIIIVIVFILLLFSLFKYMGERKADDNDIVEYTRENTKIFGTDSSDEENLEEDSEYQQYIDSGLVSEFVDLDFTFTDLSYTSIPNYYNKIIKLISNDDSKALLENLSPSYVKDNNITLDNVASLYKKNGFSENYYLGSLQVWGVSECILVIELKNDISGSSHFVGINYKMSDEKEIYNIYFSDYFESCGFHIKDGVAVKLDEEKLMSAINNIYENEYNSIDI